MKLRSILALGGVIVSLALVAVFAAPASTQESSREDFEEFCKLEEGRWVCGITLVADWPGIGKKGEEVTVYSQFTITEDGKALTGKFYKGNGSDTRLIAFDAGAKQIKAMVVESGGYVGQSIIYKSRGKWIVKRTGSEADGTKSEHIIMLTYTDNGNTRTVTGSVRIGDKEIDIPGEVWRRVGN